MMNEVMVASGQILAHIVATSVLLGLVELYSVTSDQVIIFIEVFLLDIVFHRYNIYCIIYWLYRTFIV